MRTVAIDFDGVLHRYDGWEGADHFNDPVPGAREFLAELRARGYRIVVWTARPFAGIQEWLVQHGMSGLVAEITDRKVPAVAYIDDRGIRFWGNWEEMLTFIEIPPWWQQND
mgnify:CR=1 FL=1